MNAMRDIGDKENPGQDLDELQQIARQRRRLPAPGRAPAGDRLQLRDGRARRWRYVSRQVEEILGYSAEECKRDPALWARLLHPDDRDRALAVETDVHLGSRNTAPVEYRLRTRDGDVVWVLDEAVLEADENGIPVWHGVIYDITERKTAEVELQRSLAQQAVVARLGERALQNGDPEALMRDAVR